MEMVPSLCFTMIHTSCTYPCIAMMMGASSLELVPPLRFVEIVYYTVMILFISSLLLVFYVCINKCWGCSKCIYDAM